MGQITNAVREKGWMEGERDREGEEGEGRKERKLDGMK